MVCDLVLAATDWVLRSLYDWTGGEVADTFARLTTIHEISSLTNSTSLSLIVFRLAHWDEK